MHIKFMAIKVFLRNCMIVAEIILDMCHCNGIIWIVINILRTYCLSILHMFVLLFFVSYVIWAYQIKRDKLDKKVELGIFIGYSSVSKAYRVFQPHTRKILISRDVYFMENEKWT